ncbi:MAG TPA: conjugal transfer protein TraN [Alphaproteobacteria bacterium]|nr:conjugal transfer protein TraN [Alphaproteobacteria bacterium]
MMRFLFIFLMSLPVLADPWTHLKQGDQTSQEFLGKVNQKQREAGPHPFYSGNKPQEANLNSKNLEGSSKSLVSQNPASQMVRESYDSRPQVKIDLDHDPLMTMADKILEDPLKVIGGTGTQVVEVQQGGKNEILNCEEAGEDSLETCIETLNVKIVRRIIQKEKLVNIHLTGCRKSYKSYHPKSCQSLLDVLIGPKRRRTELHITVPFKACLREVLSRRHNGCDRCQTPRNAISTDIPENKIKGVVIKKEKRGRRERFPIYGNTNFCSHGHLKGYDVTATAKINYEEESIEVQPDEWVSNCDRLEQRSDLGLCFYVSKVCTQGAQTRIIEGIPITRDCWQYTLTYGCSYPSKNDCCSLRARGCAQINSTCKQIVGNKCVVYSQTYECKGAPQTSHAIVGGQTPFCLDGNCRDQGWENNDEMMGSLAQLALLKELQGQFGKGGFFKGTDHRCSKYIFDFKDCCGSGNGWGKTLGITGCHKNEEELQEKRKARLCHYVGKYCAKKDPIAKICLEKKSTYCCFGSKLLKAFHEQGRAQIGLGWGSPKHPLCRGFTIEEIQRIDFSKLDLREVFEDLIKDFKPGKMQGLGKGIGERLETIKKGVLPPTEKQPKQREGA